MMKQELEEVVPYRGYEIGIFQDEDALDPRSEDNLGVMACWHSRYQLGDLQPGVSPGEYMEAIEAFDKQAVVLPLYLYDHSGITMRTTPFTCPFDSGQVGFIHVSKEKVRGEYGKKRISAKLLGLVKEILVGEVKTYDAYLTGNVYGYMIRIPGTDYEDGTWGFYGSDREASGLFSDARASVDYLSEKG